MLSCNLLVFITGITFATAQVPTLRITESKQTGKEGDSIYFTCILDYAVSSASGVLDWTHTRRHATNAAIYSNGTSIPRIKVILGVDNTFASNFTTLVIYNATSDDTGMISCRYTYNVMLRPTVLQEIGSLCISSRPPVSPDCFTGDNMLNVFCTANSECLNDITLRWFDNDTMEELIGVLTVNEGSVGNELARNDESNTYVCILESTVYEDVHLDCSVEHLTNGMFTKINEVQTTNPSKPFQETSSFSSISSEIKTTPPTDTSSLPIIYTTYVTPKTTPEMQSAIPMTTETDKSGFTLTLVIIVAFAGAGGMFIIAIMIIAIATICKRSHTRKSDASFEIKFEDNNITIQNESADKNLDQDHEDHLSLETEEELLDKMTETDEIPIYSKPIKNRPVLKESSNQTLEHNSSLVGQESYHYATVSGGVRPDEKSTETAETQMYSSINEINNQVKQADLKNLQSIQECDPDASVRENVKANSDCANQQRNENTEMNSKRHDLSRPALDVSESNQESNPYACVQETDRSKIELPEHVSVNEYAYAFIGPIMLDPTLYLTNSSSNDQDDEETDEENDDNFVDGPHYFVLEKHDHNDVNHIENVLVNETDSETIELR